MEQPTNPTAMTPAVPPRKSWAVDRRERRLLPLSFALAYLCASFLLEPGWNRGFGVTALAAGWYAALFCYRGTGGMERRANRVLMGAPDTLYLFFLAVQGVALFGDRAYLQRAGISFAEYARSGFFQLVGLAGLNIALILTAVWFYRADRRLRVLSTALVGLTGVLLVSAAWRMTLYVSAYGLSFKRMLTYWGMVILAVFLALTVLKIWRKDFSFFRSAAPVALAWWLLLNYCNVDMLVSRYNAARVEKGELPYSAVEDLLYHRSGYDGLSALHLRDPDILPWIQERAAEDCESWTSWSVSAWRAAGK